MRLTRFRFETVVIAALLVPLGAGSAVAKHRPAPPAAPAAAPSTAPAATFGFTPLEAMPPAMAVAYMVAIEEELAVHGYDAGPPDGVPDRRSRQAIRAYQQDAGLPADGHASKELLDHLKFALPKVYAGQTWDDPAPGGAWEDQDTVAPRSWRGDEPGGDEPGYWPDPVIVEPLPDLPSAAPARPAPRDQQSAAVASGGVVSQVQDQLKRRGYYDGPVDGVFSTDTSAAIHRFQEDWGMPENGVIDGPLLGALGLADGGSYDL